MTSDRGPQFISSFWNEFNAILGTNIKLNTVDHPQIDGQTEIYNQYAQMTLRHSSLGGLTRFEVSHGYAPRTSWDWQDRTSSPKDINIQDARSLAHNLHSAWRKAAEHIHEAQDRMSASHNAHRREIDFNVGDYVWLDSRYYRMERPSNKLDNPTTSIFKVLKQHGNSFKLDIPASWKIHDVFPAKKLRKAASNPLPGQIQAPPDPVNLTSEDQYEVEDILACNLVKKTLMYRVTWLNRDVDFNWYNASNVIYGPHKVKSFHLSNPEQAGPPARLND